MNKQDIYKTLNIYKQILEERGYIVLYIGLYGSQNYNVDDELSDIDCKAIILPSLHDIIFRKITSKTIECENGSIDVKDLITFYNVIKKGNFSYIESIDTEYSIGDKKIKEMFKQFRPNLKSILGAMYEKKKALTHEYPSKREEFKKWGFDTKQYHHIVRLLDLLMEIDKSGNLYSFIKYDDLRERMISYKRNTYNYTKDFVETDSDKLIQHAQTLIPDDYIYKSINIDDEISKYIEDKLKPLIVNDSETCYARNFRTFDGPVPTSDLKKFPILADYNGTDVSYTVYESISIL